MTDVVIQVENLGKRYRLGRRERYVALRDVLTRAATAPVRMLRNRGSSDSSNDHIWALKDICLEVKQGEIVGMVGRNGAGKTTLLKVLTRITRPTRGRARVWG